MSRDTHYATFHEFICLELYLSFFSYTICFNLYLEIILNRFSKRCRKNLTLVTTLYGSAKLH